MKKKFIARKVKQRTCWKILPFNLDPFKKKGKSVKHAKMILCYGASDKSIISNTNLSLRRVKVLRKQTLGSSYSRIHSKSHVILGG